MATILTWAEVAAAVGTIFLASVTYWSVRQTKRDRQLDTQKAIIKEEIADFYAPIIGYASTKTGNCSAATKHLYEILTNKLFLAEETTLHKKPRSETGCFQLGDNDSYILYEKIEGTWYSFFDQVWEDYRKLMEKYGKLNGMEMPIIEKPSWFLPVTRPTPPKFIEGH